jgi:hypothetical protein
METAASGSADDLRRLMLNARELALRVRREQRLTWFALLLFAALTFASVPAVRYGGHHLDCQAVRGGVICRVYSEAEFVYWPAALVLAYGLIVAFYTGRCRARGVGTRVRPYAVAGVLIAAVSSAVSFWQLHDLAAGLTLMGRGPSLLPDRLASPAAAIGLALLALAWAERSRILLFLTLGYLGAVLAGVTFAGVQTGVHAAGSSWYYLPAVFQGCVLLAGGIGFALAQRPMRALPA